MLEQTVIAIAEQLPHWQLDRETQGWRSVRLVRPDIPEAALWFNERNGRIEVGGEYPQHAYVEHRPSISISATRPPAQIAADIKRRLLPEYLQTLGRAVAQLRAHEAHISAVNAGLDALAAALGCQVHQYEDFDRSGRIYHYHHGAYRRVQVAMSGDKVDLELDGLDPDLAHAIFKLLR